MVPQVFYGHVVLSLRRGQKLSCVDANNGYLDVLGGVNSVYHPPTNSNGVQT